MDQQIELWNRASLHVLDVRHVTIVPGPDEIDYRLPSSAYIVVLRGKGTVRLHHALYDVTTLRVFHAAKGMTFTVRAQERLEYCLILYRAWLTLNAQYRLMRMPDLDDPFRLAYSLVPLHPLGIHGQIRELLSAWQSGSPLARLRVRAIFHQLVYEWLAQAHKQANRRPEPNIVEQAVRLMFERIQEPLALEQLARQLGCSSRYLTQQFRQQLRESPLRVLTRIRLARAAFDLRHTDAPLQEIATRIGYVHAFTLNKIFKKHLGMSPGAYRQGWKEGRPLPKWPDLRADSDIVRDLSALYNDNDNHVHHLAGRERNSHMNRNVSLSVSTLLVCLALLVSACGGNGTPNAGSAAPSALSTAAATAPAASTETATRIVSTMKGDIVIPVDPKRVIGIPIEYRELLHALGVTPVAAQNNNEEFPSYLGEDFKDVIKLGGGAELPFEAMLNAEPDLIVASSWAAAETFDQLNKIAPTVVLQDTDWRSTLTMMGDALDKKQEAQQILADYETAVADAKQRLDAIVGDATVLMLQVNGKDYQVIGMKNGRAHILYEELGLKPPESDALQEESQLIVSLESIPDFAPDYILLQLFDEEAESKATFDTLMNHPVFQKMDAYRNNRVFPIGQENGGKEWHLFSFSPQGNLYGIRQIVEVFESNAK